MENYINILRVHNLKVTPQRLALVEILSSYGHINIDSLYRMMVDKFTSISLATIYKNINIMIKNSLIQEVKLPNEKSVYEIVKERHSHPMCRECLDVEDIILDISGLLDRVREDSDFSVEYQELVFVGRCKNCS